MRGTVKFYDPRKHWGFITSDGQDIFVHERNLILESYLSAGDVVEFTLETTFKGNKALNVVKVY